MKTASSPGKSRADPLFSGWEDKPLPEWIRRLQSSQQHIECVKAAAARQKQDADYREQRYEQALKSVSGEETALFLEEIRRRRELFGGLRLELPEDPRGGEYSYRYDSIFLRPGEEERYQRSLTALQKEWEELPPSDAQAKELLFSPLGRSCIRGLRKALEQGKKYKANACLDMLRFLPGVYRLCRRDGEGVYSLRGWIVLSQLTANSLFQAMDQYYDLFRQFEETEKAYYPCKTALAEALQQARELSGEVKDRVDEEGIREYVRKMLREGAKTEEASRLVPQLLRLQRHYTIAKAYSDLISCRKLLMLRLKEEIRSLVETVKRSTIDLGSDDPGKEPSHYDRLLREYSEKINRLVLLSYQVMEKSQRLSVQLRGIDQWPEQVSSPEEYEELLRPEEAALQILQELWKKMEPLLPERGLPSREELLGSLPSLAR